MRRSYPDELAAWIKTRAPKKRRQDVAAVAFLTVRADVKDAIDAGYAVSTIYEHMRETGRVKSTYETFRKHVQRFIKAAPAAVASKPPSTEAKQSAVQPQPKKTEPAGIAGLTFNPQPNKKDLL